MIFLKNKLLLILFSVIFISCNLTDLEKTESEFEGNNDKNVTIKIAKWHKNHSAALSITNDSGNMTTENEKEIQHIVLEKGLNINYEIVTDSYFNDSIRLNYLYNNYLSSGLGYYGHGNTHINHDELTKEEALKSFKKCYDTMIQMGLKPVSYAYPGGFGYNIKTQEALKESGFLSGRKFEKLDFDFPYIMPDNISKPNNWYQLPTLVMQAYNYQYCSICINNTSELIPYLKNTIELNAWLILTYHSIGDLNGYGNYYLEDFINDLEAIRKRDFWVASMDDITLYSYERNSAEIISDVNYNKNGEIKDITVSLKDNLDDEIFDFPLTIVVSFPKDLNVTEITLKKNSKLCNDFNITSNQLLYSLIPNRDELIISF